MGNAPLEILYRDEHLVAVNKPAGLMVHRSRLAGRSDRFVMQILRNQLGRRVYPVHRLDKPTSGAMLFALTREAARELVSRFARKQVQKTYLAVVRGFLDPEGRVDKPLSPDVYRKKDPELTKPAQTLFRRLAQIELPYPVGRYETCRYTLLQLHPLTGRMHQIRRHMRDISHPVIGDRRYGDTRHNRMFEERFACRRMLLASVRLDFPHPVLSLEIGVDAPVDGLFGKILELFSWQDALPPPWTPRPFLDAG